MVTSPLGNETYDDETEQYHSGRFSLEQTSMENGGFPS